MIVDARRMIPLAAVLTGVLSVCLADTENTARWPQFHGPKRDNISLDTGLLKTWPDGGPALIWKYTECGGGYSGVSIADGMIFTAGDFRRREFVIALTMDGELLWKRQNGKSWTGPRPGSRATPTYDDGSLYHMSPAGTLTAYRAKSGEPIWSVDLVREFEAEYGTWAMAENVAIEEDRVLCVPGGKKGRVIALDRKTGKTIWANTAFEETAAYCSPVLVTHGGIRQLITMTQKSVIAVDVQSGELLWSHPHVTPNDQNVTMPVFSQGHVFVTSGHFAGGRLLKIDENLRGVSEVWYRKDLDNCHGGVILLEGRLYGSSCRLGKNGFFCVDFLTGRTAFTDKTLDKLSLTYADGRLYGLDQKGTMFLLAPTEKGLTVSGKFAVPRENNDYYFAHPVVCGGRLYIRHGNELYAYDVHAKPVPQKRGDR